MDIAKHRLYKPVNTADLPADKRSFLKVFFANKGLDAINISNILHNKNIKCKIPSYFEDKSVPTISDTYTKPIESKILTINGHYKNSISMT